MTREEAKRRAELYSALAEGKTIQVQNSYTDEWRDLDINKIYGFINGFNYRIKPQQKYRPFKNQEECWEEMLKHQPFGWIQNGGCREQIGRVYELDNGMPMITFSCNEGSNWHTEEVFRSYSFVDGTPFGLKEE